MVIFYLNRFFTGYFSISRKSKCLRWAWKTQIGVQKRADETLKMVESIIAVSVAFWRFEHYLTDQEYVRVGDPAPKDLLMSLKRRLASQISVLRWDRGYPRSARRHSAPGAPYRRRPQDFQSTMWRHQSSYHRFSYACVTVRTVIAFDCRIPIDDHDAKHRFWNTCSNFKFPGLTMIRWAYLWALSNIPR